MIFADPVLMRCGKRAAGCPYPTTTIFLRKGIIDSLARLEDRERHHHRNNPPDKHEQAEHDQSGVTQLCGDAGAEPDRAERGDGLEREIVQGNPGLEER